MARDRPSRTPTPDLEAKVRFLSRPSTYPDHPRTVETVETHMAWVFLTDAHAYKLKKPFRSAYLDFSTPLARRRMCREEVRLNRRLAPSVYLAAIPMSLAEPEGLTLGPGVRTVDWLVKMRRLPARFMLDARIRAGDPPLDRLRRLGQVLARFYAEAPSTAMTVLGYLDRTRRQISENRAVGRRYGVPAAMLEAALAPQERFLTRHGDLLAARVRAGRIVDGHGDLRPEHVCLLPVPVVIDCLEFNRDLRQVDPLDDLAFLLLECRRLGGTAAGLAVLDGYRRSSGDPAPQALLQFYEGFRAGIRAKLALWHLRDVGADHPAVWIRQAEDYLRLAREMIELAPD